MITYQLLSSIKKRNRSAMTLLISVLVLGAVALIVGAGMAIRGIEEVDIGRSVVQTIETLAATESCMEEALLNVKRFGAGYAGTSMAIGDGNCEVTVSGIGNAVALQSTGSVRQWTRHVYVDVLLTGANIQIQSWSHNDPDTESLPPIASVFEPANGSNSIPVDSVLEVTFSEPVYVRLGADNDIKIRKASDGSIFETIDIQSVQVSGNGTNTITINPSSDFAEATEYYVQIGGEALEDLAGNLFAGITDVNTWRFTTFAQPDSTPPEIFSLSPSDNSTNVAVAYNLRITFTESVLPQAGTLNDIIIKRSSDNVIFESIDAISPKITGGGTSTITINPTSNFALATSYYVLVQADAFDDAAGNNFAGISSVSRWNFTTESCVKTQPSETICSDGYDNDCNGLIDCDDSNCAGDAYCTGESSSSSTSGYSCIETENPEYSCSDYIDNDCDSYIDCSDSDCYSDPYCGGSSSSFGCIETENPEYSCSDYTDNDCDGYEDCSDPDCYSDPYCGGGSSSF